MAHSTSGIKLWCITLEYLDVVCNNWHCIDQHRYGNDSIFSSHDCFSFVGIFSNFTKVFSTLLISGIRRFPIYSRLRNCTFFLCAIPHPPDLSILFIQFSTCSCFSHFLPSLRLRQSWVWDERLNSSFQDCRVVFFRLDLGDIGRKTSKNKRYETHRFSWRGKKDSARVLKIRYWRNNRIIISHIARF